MGWTIKATAKITMDIKNRIRVATSVSFCRSPTAVDVIKDWKDKTKRAIEIKRIIKPAEAICKKNSQKTFLPNTLYSAFSTVLLLSILL